MLGIVGMDGIEGMGGMLGVMDGPAAAGMDFATWMTLLPICPQRAETVVLWPVAKLASGVLVPLAENMPCLPKASGASMEPGAPTGRRAMSPCWAATASGPTSP